jgi:hypothetical protein
MELTKVIAELRAERAAIDEALAALDRIARATAGKRRGRPPAWMAAAGAGTGGAIAAAPGEPRKKRSLSPEVRKKMAEAQKKRWAAYRKDQGAVAK